MEPRSGTSNIGTSNIGVEYRSESGLIYRGVEPHTLRACPFREVISIVSCSPIRASTAVHVMEGGGTLLPCLFSGADANLSCLFYTHLCL